MLESALVIHNFLKLTDRPVYSREMERLLTWLDMLVGKSVATLRSSAIPRLR
jgi:hypothetical protein